MDAAWGRFLQYINYKAENAGRGYIEVCASGTTQECSRCGTLIKKKLSDREHNCKNCGLMMDRDLNAAINVLNRGLKHAKQKESGDALSEQISKSSHIK